MRLKRAMGLLILLCGFKSISAYGQVVATWTGGSGNWSNAANWSSNPSAPHNIVDSATIATPGSLAIYDIPYASINSLNLGTTDSLSINAADSLQTESTVNSGVFANNGAFSIAGSGFCNYGTLLNASGGTLENSDVLYNYGGFTNSGQIVSYGQIRNYGTVTNYGAYTYIESGSFLNYGTLANYGLFDFNNGFDNLSGAKFTNYGTVTDTLGSDHGSNNGTFNNVGTFSSTADDPFSNSGTINNTGTINNFLDPSSPGSGTINNTGAINNSGTINNKGTINNTSGASFLNFGTLISNAFTNSGTFANSGSVTISLDGLFATSTNYTQTAGSTLVNGTLAATGSAIVNIQGGVLGGAGTIIGNVAMGGTLTPGAPGTPGTLTIVGNYEQIGNGTLEELIGPLSQSSLNVIGGVALDSGASLDIALLNGYDPLGQTFDIMNYNSLVGQFSNGSSFWDDGYLWDVSYGQNQIDVKAVQVPEPSSLSMLLIGLAALAFCAHRSRIKTQHIS
jgi:hypothetical protein